MDEKSEMAKFVRRLRSLTGLTQEKFAAKVGVTFPTVNRWENDKAKPSPLALQKIEELALSMGVEGKSLMKDLPAFDTLK